MSMRDENSAIITRMNVEPTTEVTVSRMDVRKSDRCVRQLTTNETPRVLSQLTTKELSIESTLSNAIEYAPPLWHL